MVSRRTHTQSQHVRWYRYPGHLSHVLALASTSQNYHGNPPHGRSTFFYETLNTVA
jgi:hypothetical protein